MARKVSGVTIKFNKIPKLKKLLPAQADRVVEGLAREGEAYLKTNFGISPAPVGSFPGVDTGALRSSISVVYVKPMQRRIVDGVFYGVLLEFGTSRMGARPFMGPTADYLRRNGTQIAVAVWEDLRL